MPETSMGALQELVSNRRRSRFRGGLDEPHKGPNVDFFSTHSGAAAASYDFYPTKQLILPALNIIDEQAFLHFSLSNATELYVGNNRLQHRFEPGYCSVGFIRSGNPSELRYEADQIHREVCIYIPPALLTELMWDKEAPDIQPNNQTDDSFSVIKTLPIDGTQSLLLRDLFSHNPYQGAIHDLYRESKLLELICLTTSKLRHETSAPTTDIGRKDMVMIHKAKELLLQDIQNPPSLKTLARRAGTNEFKLKKGFKQMFGQTVYGMLHEVRLIEAKRLIEQDGMGVHEAASWVGYKSASHFSSIFKRRFGILPKQLKKQISYFYTL
ncbi:MAG: AraC family transcriptional regulator [Candidatus Thiodiazotropha sp. (ex Ctena orbiculata)]|nr:AraC family transcriptional regulator [Candidatus Thiodiazotropha taylori]